MEVRFMVGFALMAMGLSVGGCTHLSSTPSAPPYFAPDTDIDQASGSGVARLAQTNTIEGFCFEPAHLP
ncbi:MAG TPA: hypothetical protein VED47_06150 [Burkholderiaceae bacterium]|nr:hypothetical protein [Burkholderiaceae bacterium]